MHTHLFACAHLDFSTVIQVRDPYLENGAAHNRLGLPPSNLIRHPPTTCSKTSPIFAISYWNSFPGDSKLCHTGKTSHHTPQGCKNNKASDYITEDRQNTFKLIIDSHRFIYKTKPHSY